MASSSESRMTFQVFLSFEGSDVPKNFLEHLDAALKQKKIFTYVDFNKDDDKADLAIIIFSKEFLYSKRCLEEVAAIRKRKDLRVFPVFYHVTPSDVRQRGTDLLKHGAKYGKENVKRWNEALVDASNFTRWLLGTGSSEATLIEDIIKTMSELKRFDVYLSFRGQGDCENFVKSLNEALVQKDIKTFMDSGDLRMGRDFKPKLMDAMEQSCMYIVVFSEGYAKSWWCLKELVKILETKNRSKQLMLPIFYKVDPGDVRAQKKSYEGALRDHETEYGKRTVKKWREALTEVANMQGKPLRDGNEDGWIPDILKDIEKMMAEIR